MRMNCALRSASSLVGIVHWLALNDSNHLSVSVHCLLIPSAAYGWYPLHTLTRFHWQSWTVLPRLCSMSLAVQLIFWAVTIQHCLRHMVWCCVGLRDNTGLSDTLLVLSEEYRYLQEGDQRSFCNLLWWRLMSSYHASLHYSLTVH